MELTTSKQPACWYCGATLTDMGLRMLEMEWPEGLALDDSSCCTKDDPDICGSCGFHMDYHDLRTWPAECPEEEPR